MRSFCIKVATWTLPGTFLCLGTWIGLLYHNPSRDTLGLYRVMPIECNSMIFGTSRSAQGVNPDVLKFHAPHSGDWLNFSFNLGVSPWNEAYADAIVEKTKCSVDSTKPSFFLVFVDPWVLDEKNGQGRNSWLKLDWVSVCNINHTLYALRNTNPIDVIGFWSGGDLLSIFGSSIPRQFLNLFTQGTKTDDFQGVKPNGWLPNPKKLSLIERQAAIAEKIKWYREQNIPGNSWPNKENKEALARVVLHLKGKFPLSHITLVRPPVCDEMLELEREWFPQSNEWLNQFSAHHSVDYIDFNEAWADRNVDDFVDAHHMSVEGANRFSKVLAEQCLMPLID